MRILQTALVLAEVGTLVALTAGLTAHADGPQDSVIYLNQARSQADREMFHQTSQDSRLLDYDIFLHVEVADGQELFRSATNSERYGLIAQAPLAFADHATEFYLAAGANPTRALKLAIANLENRPTLAAFNLVRCEPDTEAMLIDVSTAWRSGWRRCFAPFVTGVSSSL